MCYDLTVRLVVLVLMSALPIAAQSSYVEELRKENRLPEWANYVCYDDAKNLQNGPFILVAYQLFTDDIFTKGAFKDAKELGYKRGLTYQEYIGLNMDIGALNMPLAPETYASKLQTSVQTGQITGPVADLLTARLTSIKNASALAKAVRKSAVEFPPIEKVLLQDEEELALLDAPDGTNYHNFIAKHPGFPDNQLNRQKYLNAGIINPTFKIYREGNVIFEKDFGIDVFETQGESEKLLKVRIEMQETSSGLRFLMSHSFGNAGAGIPVAGRCDLISKPLTK